MGAIDVKKSEEISSSILGLSPENRLINVKQKHKNSLLLAVYEHEHISHAELAAMLKISPSGLNAVVEKICEGCEPENSPLTFKKMNKYKYYHLTDSGKQYVEDKLISVEEREYERKLGGYWESFQSRTRHDLDGEMEHFLEQYAKAAENPNEKEDQDVINSFMDCLFAFYLKMPQDALSEMEHLITNEKIRDKIKAIICDKMADRKIMEPLEKMAAENPEDGYQFADSVMEHISDWNSENIWKLKGGYEWETMKSVMQKIESDMLRAVMNFQDAESLKERWLRNGMNIHLANYLAVKYKYMLLQHEWDREKRDSQNKKLQKDYKN